MYLEDVASVEEGVIYVLIKLNRQLKREILVNVNDK